MVKSIKSNLLVKHNGTFGRFKSCKIRIEIAWKEKDKANYTKSRICWKVSSVGGLTIYLGSLFHDPLHCVCSPNCV